MKDKYVDSIHSCLSVIANCIFSKAINVSSQITNARKAIIKLDKISHTLKFPQAVINRMRENEKAIFIGIQKHDYQISLNFADLKYQINYGLGTMNL